MLNKYFAKCKSLHRLNQIMAILSELFFFFSRRVGSLEGQVYKHEYLYLLEVEST